MVFAVVDDIFKEVFLVGEFLVVFEVVEGMLKDAIIDAILIFVCFIGLLPFEIDEQLLAVSLNPLLPSRQHPSHQIAIVAAPNVEFEGLFRVGGKLTLGNGVGPLWFLLLVES